MARRRDGQEARRRDTRPMKEGGLEAERLSLSDLLDTLPVPVIVYGADGRVLFANQARKDFAGDDVATLDGAIARTAPATEDGQILPRERLPALRALRGESVRGERLRLRAADGHTEVLLVNASPLRDADGKIAAAVVVVHDITDLSDLERGRRELFAMAIHDLRTPITVILAFVQLARRVALTLERDEIVVRVTDHGGGIDADERALLFQPFYQTPRGRSYGGTGLGLHISRRIAEAHGGRLWLEDTVPGKTTFALALPRR